MWGLRQPNGPSKPNYTQNTLHTILTSCYGTRKIGMRFSSDQYLFCWEFTYPLRWIEPPSLKRISVGLLPTHASQKFSLASWSVSQWYLMQMHMQKFCCHLCWWNRHAQLCASQATHLHKDLHSSKNFVLFFPSYDVFYVSSACSFIV